MKAEIISVGNELLAGTTLNTNTAFLSRNLALMGYEVHRQSVIGDVESEIMEAVTTASKRSHVTIFTGGLGPTEDDMTKESVAKAFGLALVKDPDVEKQIKRIFEERGREMTENNLKQAMVINGCEVLENKNGTAPGIYLQTSKQAIILLPGPAAEMELMFENEVKKRLEAMNDMISASASLHVFGIGESALEEEIKDLLYGENPTAALYAKTGEVHIDLVAHAKTKMAAEEILESKVDEIRDRVGDYIYSEDGTSMAETVVNLLKQTKTKIALAESCTGGMMAASITDYDGASKIFEYGMAAYSDATKQRELDVNSSVLRKYSSISSATAAEMAKGARTNGNADIGVGITGVAGARSDHVNKPVGLVYIAIADKKRTIVKKFNFGSNRSRKMLREISVLNAFDMVRRFLLGMEIEDSRTFGEEYVADDNRRGKLRKKSALVAQKTISQIVMVLLVLGGVFLGYRAVRTRINQSVYNELKSLYSDGVSIAELSKRNPDTVGWITVEDTEVINTVVVKGKDDYYDNHDFDGASNDLGCLYVDTSINIGSDPDNIVIYGTSNDAGQMFGPLLNYTDPAYLSYNYMIDFKTSSTESKYKVVSVMYTNSNTNYGGVQNFYNKGDGHFLAADDFMEFVIQSKMRSVVNVDTDILPGDKFLTLVTDTPEWAGAKLVVVARMVRSGEWTAMTSAMFSNNMMAAYPDIWYELNGYMPTHNEIVERDKWMNWMLANEKNAGGSTYFSPASGGVGSGNTSDTGISENKHGGVDITVYMNGAIVTDTPANIVSQIVAYEMSESYSDEALKAQAVTTASWLRYCYENIGVPDVSGSTPGEKIKGLVESVIDEALYYNGSIAFTTYFKSTSSRTYNSEDVWGESMNFPYLRSVESSGDSQVANKNSRTSSIQEELFRSKLENYYQIKLSDNRDNWLKIVETGAGGVIKTVSIDGQVTDSGINFIEKCLVLESANFSFYWIYTGSINITTVGVGHGVGMSQAGAQYYASTQGWTYKQILEHYFTGISFGQMDWGV